MGLIDELKKDAETTLDKEQRDRLVKERQDAALGKYLKQIQPTMLRAYHYLRELVETLNVAQPDIAVDYDVEGMGQLKGLRQGEYEIHTEDLSHISSMTLGCRCTGRGEVVFHRDSRANVQHQRDYLWNAGLKFRFKEVPPAKGSHGYRGEFHVERHVPIKLVFEVDLDRQGIKMTFRNLRGLGESIYNIKVDQLDTHLLEEVGKALLRKPNRLDELTGFRLSDDIRKNLQARLERDARAKEKEIGKRETKRVKQEAAPDGSQAGAKKSGFWGGLFKKK